MKKVMSLILISIMLFSFVAMAIDEYDFEGVSSVDILKNTMKQENGKLVSLSKDGLSTVSLKGEFQNWDEYTFEMRFKNTYQNNEIGGFLSVLVRYVDDKSNTMILSRNTAMTTKKAGDIFEDQLRFYRTELNVKYDLKLEVSGNNCYIYAKKADEKTFKYMGQVKDISKDKGMIQIRTYQVLTEIENIKVVKGTSETQENIGEDGTNKEEKDIVTTLPQGEVIKQEIRNPEFYDNFSSGTQMWETANGWSVSNGKVINMNSEGISPLELKAESRNWLNMTMSFRFKWQEAFTQKSGFLGINLRCEKDIQSLMFIIRNTGINYTYMGALEESGGAFNFENEKEYDVKFQTRGSGVNIYCKNATDETYTKIGAIGGIGLKQNIISFMPYNAKVALDDVRIWNDDYKDERLYIKNSYVKLLSGESKELEFNNNTGDNVTFKSSDEKIVTVDNGKIIANTTGNAVVTITAGKYTKNVDIVVYEKVRGIYLTTDLLELYEGENVNISCTVLPTQVQDKAVKWERSNEDVVAIFGDSNATRAIMAKAKGNATINVTTLQGGYTESIYVVVKERDHTMGEDTILAIRKNANKIPTEFYGMHSNDNETAMRGLLIKSKEDLRKNDEINMQALSDMHAKNVRACGENYDWQAGTVLGNTVKDGDTRYELEDVCYKASKLGISQVYAVSMHETDEEILESIKRIKTATNGKPLYIELGNEGYAMYCLDQLPTVEHYIQRSKSLYKKIKELDSTIQVGIVILDKALDIAIGADPNNFPTNEQDLAYTQGVRAATWNKVIAENPDCYDAIIVHQYTGLSSYDNVTADQLMDYFFSYNEFVDLGYKEQALQYPDKEIWVTEFGDLPSLFWTNDINEKSRMQYMKSIGNALQYGNRFFKMLQSNLVTVMSYHYLNDSQGFGAFQTDKDGNMVKLPPYYMFVEAGRLLDENTHFYNTLLLKGATKNDVIELNAASRDVCVRGIDAWGFGDENTVREAALMNTTNKEIKVSLTNYNMKKTWSYGSETPLPNYMVNTVSAYDPPKEIPIPEVFDGSFEKEIVVAPYTMVVVKLEKNQTMPTSENLATAMKNSVAIQVDSPKTIVQDGYETTIDNNLSVCPQIVNNKTFVPIRFISERFGYIVKWDAENQKITVTDNDITLTLNVGSNVMKKNDETITLEEKVYTQDNRSYVPIRDILEAMGKNVKWGNNNVIIISDKNSDISSDIQKDIEKMY